MMIARWQIDARFGQKQAVINSLTKWVKEIGSQIGWTDDKVRIISGSVGALESTVEVEVRINDLNELNDSWERLGGIEAHKKWGLDIEPYVVSGTPNWKIYRVIKDF